MSKAAAPLPSEFATAMQHLSAEATKLHPASFAKKIGEPSELSENVQALKTRLDGFEKTMTEKFDQLATALASEKPGDSSAQFKKIEDQLSAIHSSETVNHRLFDSLHSELLAYRDNFLHESLQKPFIHDLVLLFDHLTSLSDQLRSAAAQDSHGNLVKWRDNLENAIHSLVEILHRFDVKEIEPKENVDRAIHRVVSFEPADFAEEDGRIVMRVRRGFFWRGNLIRPEEVIAKRFG
ncbi:MAG TPA: nucleotide exchange factor GrpE [Chthoniobacterales bacterium]